MVDLSALAPKIIVFLLLWGVFLGVCLYSLKRIRTASGKRRAGLWMIYGAGFLFTVGLYSLIDIPIESLFLIAPAVAFSCWVQAKRMRFCEKCSAFHFLQPFNASKSCRNCGTSLEDSAL